MHPLLDTGFPHLPVAGAFSTVTFGPPILQPADPPAHGLCLVGFHGSGYGGIAT